MLCVPCGPRGAFGVGRSFVKSMSLCFCLSRCVWGEEEMYIISGADSSGSGIDLCEFFCAMRGGIEREGFVSVVVALVGCVMGTCFPVWRV